eukprot:scaffold129770_cov26-Tisochrysis_lutea.AAC.1
MQMQPNTYVFGLKYVFNIYHLGSSVKEEGRRLRFSDCEAQIFRPQFSLGVGGRSMRRPSDLRGDCEDEQTHPEEMWKHAWSIQDSRIQ